MWIFFTIQYEIKEMYQPSLFQLFLLESVCLTRYYFLGQILKLNLEKKKKKKKPEHNKMLKSTEVKEDSNYNRKLNFK